LRNQFRNRASNAGRGAKGKWTNWWGRLYTLRYNPGGREDRQPKSTVFRNRDHKRVGRDVETCPEGHVLVMICA